MVLEMVQRVRKRLPKTGTRKLYQHMQEELQNQQVKIGRDKLFHLLRSSGLLIKKTKRYHITTDSKHFFLQVPQLSKRSADRTCRTSVRVGYYIHQNR